MKSRTLLAFILGLATPGTFAQLSGSVSVQGEYEPLVIETERLNAFPEGYRFDLPSSTLSYDYTGVVTDFRPGLLTMGATGRLTDWPWPVRRGFIDARLGSYLDSRLHAGYYILADSTHTLLADLRFRSTAYRDLYTIPDTERRHLLGGDAGVSYTGHFGGVHAVHAEARGGYTGYDRGNRQGNLSAGAGYAFTFNDVNTLTIDIKGDFLFPRRVYGNYGVLAFNPAYRYADGRFTLRAGADLSVAYDAMGNSKGERFGTFHAAPDVSLQYRVNSGVGVFLTATGGVEPSTLYFPENSEPFLMPWLFSPQPIYTPADARGGVEIGPFFGFAASAAFRYAVARNVPLEAWKDFTEEDIRSANLHGFGLDWEVRYAYGSVVRLGFTGSYTPQRGFRGLFNGIDRPRWIMEATGAVRPVKKLEIRIGYAYRGVRNCYSRLAGGLLEAYRMPDITDLNAKITYSLLDNLDIYCSGRNLLNRHTELVPSLQSEGIAISGGIYFEF